MRVRLIMDIPWNKITAKKWLHYTTSHAPHRHVKLIFFSFFLSNVKSF